MRSYGGEVVEGRVVEVTRSDDRHFRLLLTGGHVVIARRVLAATGLVDELPEIEGLAAHWGRDVIHARSVTGSRSGTSASSRSRPTRWRCTPAACCRTAAETVHSHARRGRHRRSQVEALRSPVCAWSRSGSGGSSARTGGVAAVETVGGEQRYGLTRWRMGHG